MRPHFHLCVGFKHTSVEVVRDFPPVLNFRHHVLERWPTVSGMWDKRRTRSRSAKGIALEMIAAGVKHNHETLAKVQAGHETNDYCW